MFGDLNSARIRTAPHSRGNDDAAAHLARRHNWVADARRSKAKAVIAGEAHQLAQSTRVPAVSVLAPTARPNRLKRIYQTLAQQQDVQVQLVLLPLGFCPSDAYLRCLAHTYGVEDVVYLYLPDNVPLGECCNYCVRAADGDIVAIMDDEDHYGPHYLSDQLYSLKHSGADIVAKQAQYRYLEQLDATLLRFSDREQQFTTSVTAATTVAYRAALQVQPFPFINDQDDPVLRHRAGELTAYSTDRFNYFQTRFGANTGPGVPSPELLSSGRFQFFGNPAPRIDI